MVPGVGWKAQSLDTIQATASTGCDTPTATRRGTIWRQSSPAAPASCGAWRGGAASCPPSRDGVVSAMHRHTQRQRESRTEAAQHAHQQPPEDSTACACSMVATLCLSGPVEHPPGSPPHRPCSSRMNPACFRVSVLVGRTATGHDRVLRMQLVGTAIRRTLARSTALVSLSCLGECII